ncbi:reticulon-like protein B9 isoform X1 [Gossypium australe]|uniref:Reticulon-like protein n=1 Tax=Gossypium australe TaxID=47621 RepID=A0A5B6UPG7_9ROSI|nr:reticulon-like protein B9 isoform X1 [Gossypium australe]
MPINKSYESDGETTTPRVNFFGRERPVHAILGVADVLLWRNQKLSATLLFGVTAIWYLFEVVEYNFVTLFCHICITTMLIIPELISNEDAFREVVSTIHRRLNELLRKFLHIAGGNDPLYFFLVLTSLYIISVIGSIFNFLDLLFVGFLCMETLPYLYARYEKEVEYHAGQMTRKASKMYKRFDSRVLNKIPRGPVKEKKRT